VGALAVELRASLRAPPLERVLSRAVRSLLAQKRCTPWAERTVVGFLCGAPLPAAAHAALDAALGAPPDARAAARSRTRSEPGSGDPGTGGGGGTGVDAHAEAHFKFERHVAAAATSMNAYAQANLPETFPKATPEEKQRDGSGGCIVA
jgi:hypothetical protein